MNVADGQTDGHVFIWLRELAHLNITPVKRGKRRRLKSAKAII